jgi:hypothetical protein
MRCSRTILLSLVAVSLLASGAAQAQTQAPSSPAPMASLSAQASKTMTDVSKWSRKQWNVAKAKWVEEKDSWNGCQTRAQAQNLSGRKSWQFLYDCMTKS